MFNNNPKEENKNIKDTLLNLQKILNSSKCSNNLLSGCLMMEYKYLQKFCPSGIYILPILDDIKVWQGVIFVKDGPFSGGMYKFDIRFPQNYPTKNPEVFFNNKIIHPLIQDTTGKLDLTKKFPDWESGKNYSIQVIYFIQEIFYEEKFYYDETSYNPAIACVAKQNFQEFVDKIKRCNEINHNNRYDNKEGSSIVFSKFNENHQLIKNKIISQDPDVDIFERIEDFKSWFMNNFSEQILKKDNS